MIKMRRRRASPSLNGVLMPGGVMRRSGRESATLCRAVAVLTMLTGASAAPDGQSVQLGPAQVFNLTTDHEEPQSPPFVRRNTQGPPGIVLAEGRHAASYEMWVYFGEAGQVFE